MRKPSRGEVEDMREKLGARRPQRGSAVVPGSKFVLRAESFSSWLKGRLALEAKGRPQPVQMPKVDSNKIEFKKPNERKKGGRRDTTMDTRPKRERTRGDRNRKAIRGQD